MNGRKPVNAQLHTEDLKIDQKGPINEAALKDREPEIVQADTSLNQAYYDELAFNEEPVTIRIEPSSEKNAPKFYECWVNGKGAEVWNEQSRQWIPITYLPVGQEIIVKRKYVAVLAAAKRDNIQTRHDNAEHEVVNNYVDRSTSAVANFTVISDKNPRGHAWLSEIRRRNF